MRALLTVIVIAALAWSIYWAVGSTGVNTAFNTWFEDRRSEGWVAEVSALETKGFPNRFDTTFSDVSLADPETGLAWEAPFFQIFALSYKPNHVIAVWPNEQRIATPLAKYDLASEDMRASLVTQAATTLPLDRLTLTAEALSVLEEGAREPTRAKALTLAVERQSVAENSYRLGFKADGFSPALDWRVQIDPNGTLPDTLDALSADLTVDFDAPWDINAIQTARPQPRKINLRLAEARWGQLELQAAGEMTVDAAGIPEGEITIKARNWRDILKLAVETGAIPEGFAGSLEDGLSLMSQLAGNPKTLDIPLGLRGGRVLLGPVPIGPAPRLVLR
ncbi:MULTISPECIES: DUF2125 domain-containing protein [Roseovarius]|uniref:DUF2125 domain-containing protein n=2 Tax=Roseovarius TaxID=74030 RepID=A0ABZ2HJG4_9RHOB|nr:DUF2125 domain-containing protein [Roseovarius sp. W115]MDV2929427.1 DUF2125 domain-containing protein [Roseovarius sp. W115]